MVYVNFNNETYCVHWRYVKKNESFEKESVAYDKEFNEDVITVEQLVPSDAYKHLKNFKKYQDGECIVTQCIVDIMKGVNDYAPFAVAEVQRSIKDRHVKAIARTVSLRSVLSTFDGDGLKEAIVKKVWDTCNMG